MVDQALRLRPRPVFLYFDPHPVHEKMATYIGAEMVPCETGGALPRLRSGARHDFGDRPVLLEGGVPLLEGAVTSVLGESGPILALGADSTYDDMVDPQPGRSIRSRLAHRVSQRFVDGTLAISERIATLAERFSDGPVRIAHPFIEAERYEALRDLKVNVEQQRILCVGKYRWKNGQDILRAAVGAADTDVEVDFVGPDTEEIASGPGIRTHGYVSVEKLVDLFGRAGLFVFPAPVAGFGVAVIEALTSGTPAVTSPRAGTATLVRAVNGRLIADPDPTDVARAIDWYFSLPSETRRRLAETARGIGRGFSEGDGLDAFAFQFVRLLQDVGCEVTVSDV